MSINDKKNIPTLVAMIKNSEQYKTTEKLIYSIKKSIPY